VPNKPSAFPTWKAPLLGAFCLFFPCLLLAQTRILHPSPEEELTTQQVFEVAVEGESTRVELLLNGALVAARSKPPYRFEVTWNVLRTNLVEVAIRRPDGQVERLRRAYEAPAIDLRESVTITDWFPYSSRILSEEELARLTARDEMGRNLHLKASAAQAFPSALLLVVDVSGSMKPLRGGVLQFLSYLQGAGEQRAWIVFDGAASRVESLEQVQQLDPLFGRRPASAIYDALLRSLGEFPATPRRLLLLVSDGFDDSSIATPAQLEEGLSAAGVMLFWYNPTTTENKSLRQLCLRSGGLAWQGSAQRSAAEFLAVLKHQFHLRLEQKSAPVVLGPAHLSLHHPRW